MSRNNACSLQVSEWKTMARVGGKIKPVRESLHQQGKEQKKAVNEKKKHVSGSVKNAGLTATVKKTKRNKQTSIFASRFGPHHTTNT